MYAVTVMAHDQGAMAGGFAKLVTDGVPEPLDDVDRETLFGLSRSASPS
jgi:hypothetical protein